MPHTKRPIGNASASLMVPHRTDIAEKFGTVITMTRGLHMINEEPHHS